MNKVVTKHCAQLLLQTISFYDFPLKLAKVFSDGLHCQRGNICCWLTYRHYSFECRQQIRFFVSICHLSERTLHKSETSKSISSPMRKSQISIWSSAPRR